MGRPGTVRGGSYTSRYNMTKGRKGYIGMYHIISITSTYCIFISYNTWLYANSIVTNCFLHSLICVYFNKFLVTYSLVCCFSIYFFTYCHKLFSAVIDLHVFLCLPLSATRLEDYSIPFSVQFLSSALSFSVFVSVFNSFCSVFSVFSFIHFFLHKLCSAPMTCSFCLVSDLDIFWSNFLYTISLCI